MKYCLECGHALSPVALDGRERLRCPRCGWTLFEDPKLAVAVIISQGNTVLLGKRGQGLAQGRWSFPAGFVDRGEKVEDAAIREVREEIGVEIDLGPLVALLSHPGDPVVLAVYSGSVSRGTPTPGEELTDLGWFEEGNMPVMAFEHDVEVLSAWWAASKERQCAR